MGLKLTPLISISPSSTLIQFMLESKIQIEGELKISKSGKLDEDVPIGPVLHLPPVYISGVIVTPQVQPYAIINANGEIEMETKMSFENRNIAAAECRNNQWKTACKPARTEGRSPWNVQNSIKLKGEVYYGAGATVSATFYGQDYLHFGINADMGNRLYGELNLQTVDKEDLSVIATNGWLNSEYKAQGSFFMNAHLLNAKIECGPFELLSSTWGERVVKVLPTFTNMKVNKGSSATTRATKANAALSTILNGELLNKETDINFVIENEAGEVVEITEDMAYGEGCSEDSEGIPVDVAFNNLEENHTYRVYPSIHSSLYQGIDENMLLKLKHLEIEFNTIPEKSLREQLIQFYKDTDGDNWTENENWCSDKPLEEWYGISVDNEGKYSISLQSNNLSGIVNFSSEDIRNINLEYNNIVSIDCKNCANLRTIKSWNLDSQTLVSLHCKNCTNLTNVSVGNNYALTDIDASNCPLLAKLSFAGDQLKHLNACGCSSLTGAPISPAIESLDLSDCSMFDFNTIVWQSLTQIKTLKLKNCTKMENLMLSGIAPLDTLDLSGCTQLTKTAWRNGDNLKLRWISLSGCKSLTFAPYLERPSLEYIDVSHSKGCSIDLHHLPNVKYLNLEDADLFSLYLNNYDPKISILMDRCRVLRFQCSGYPLSILDKIINKEEVISLSLWSCQGDNFYSSQYPSLRELSISDVGNSSLDLSLQQ